LWSNDFCTKHFGDSILIIYRTFGFNVSRPFHTVDTSKYKPLSAPIAIGGYTYTYTESENKLIDSPTLDTRGSFTRGITIGNGQNFSLTSNFDMQLRGDLGNGLSITAAISDDNLPIQTAGNTQQLQEFDRFFIQLNKGKTSLVAGDYQLNKPKSYFMNYFKKLQGLSFTNEDDFKNGKITQKSVGSFAISNGKFGRQTINTSEGNQGPYRISGPNGERFIIILSGSERVYFNGVLLKRGYDFDYVIDYNRAELTFSPTRVIARDSRVIIEFEYTDISYLRTLYAAETSFSSNKWSVGAHLYSEQDSKNGTGDLVLDSIDINILKSSGEEIDKIQRSGLRTISTDDRNSSNLILYKGVADPTDPKNIILVFTTDLDSAQYTAIFTEIGPGKGDYIIDPAVSKNGRIYKYVGKNMGIYSPVIRLVPPEQKQMITVHGSFNPDKFTALRGEVAWSHQDKNRLSTIGNDNNQGVASWLSFNKDWKLDSLGTWQAGFSTTHEYVHRDFKALNPYRNAEFSRDWNIEQLNTIGDDNLTSARITLNKQNTFHTQYSLDRYEKTNLYLGQKHGLQFNFESGRWLISSKINYLDANSKYNATSSTFLRTNGTLSYALTPNKKWKTGIFFDGESNLKTSDENNTLIQGSYKYDFVKAFVTSDFSDDFALKLSASRRNDDIFGQSVLHRTAVAQEIEFGGQWKRTVNSDLSWNIVHRDLMVLRQDLLPNDKSKKSLIGKIDYIWSAYHSAIRSIFNYNTSSGQEPKVEFVFQKVDLGQGEYVLVGDSESPNLTNVQDFRYDPSNPAARYIRLSLVNNEFFRTNNMEINQNLVIEPSKHIWIDTSLAKKKSLRTLSKFSLQSNLRILQKQAAIVPFSIAAYLPIDTKDTSIVSYLSNISNILFFNKGSIKGDAQIGHRIQRNRYTQINGIEDRSTQDYYIRMRKSIGSQTDFFLNVEQNMRLYFSELLAIRNLDIKGYTLKPEINYRPTTQSRIVLSAGYVERKQRILNKELAKWIDVKTEYSLRKANKYSFDLSINLVQIRFNGVPNSPLEYDMLEGLKNGRNYIFNALMTYRIGKNMDLVFQYEGRKSDMVPILNIGRTQLKATF
jgi:hypothetical protein